MRTGSTLITSFLACLFLFSHASGQQIQQQLVMNPNPSRYLADWERKQETATLRIANSGNAVGAKISAKISLDGTLQAKTNTNKMPIHQIPSGVTTWDASQILPITAVEFYGAAKNTAVRTGMLPAGIYQLCIELLDPVNGNPLSQPACAVFRLISYQAPVCLQPQDGSILQAGTTPVFRWSPVTPTPPQPVHYSVQVFEVLQGQTPTQAFRSNRPILDEEIVGATQLIWPPSVMRPDTGKLVWNVQARDENDNSIGGTDGWAEPFTFTTQQNPEQQGNSSCSCKCDAIVTKIRVDGTKRYYAAKGTFECKGVWGSGPEYFACEVKSVTYSWKISSGGDVAEIEGPTDGKSVKVNTLKDGSFVLGLNVTVTCSDGSTCSCYSNIEETVNISSGCNCICSAVIKRTVSDKRRRIYVVSGTFECEGVWGSAGDRIKCGVKEITYEWSITSGDDVATIDGRAGARSVEVKLTGTGPFVLGVHVKVTCTDGKTCRCYANIEEEATMDCVLTYKWCPGKAIDLQKYGHYPNDPAVLEDMRPGETIALSVFARDEDNLLQYCTCEEGTEIHKHPPTADKVKYTWRSDSATGGIGTLIQLGGSESNSVQYQLPACFEAYPTLEEVIVSKVVVTIENAGLKADDEKIDVEFTIKLFVSSAPAGSGMKRKIVVDVTDSIRSTAKDVACEGRPGHCTFLPPAWRKGSEISVVPGSISFKLPALGFPDNLVLLHATAHDNDDLVLQCIENGIVVSRALKGVYDECDISWSIEKGKGHFLLGDRGPCVVFQHTYGLKNDVIIRCTIGDGKTQFDDAPDPDPLKRRIEPRRQPVALVGIGDIRYPLGEHGELVEAGELAEKKYRAAGYAVTFDPDVELETIEHHFKNPFSQALLLIGHGDKDAKGGMYTAGGEYFMDSEVSFWTRDVWGCLAPGRHPMIKECILLSCYMGEGDWINRFFTNDSFYSRTDWLWSSAVYSSIRSYVRKDLAPSPPRVLAPK